MKYLQHTIVFQEMPGDIALAFELTNCPFRCDNCHSPHLQQDIGEELTCDTFKAIVNKYCGLITAILFMGSAYNDEDKCLLVKMLDYAQIMGLKTCVWTGQDDVCHEIKARLDFLKTGQYVEHLGGLGSPGTNQRYIDIRTEKEVLIKRPPVTLRS